MSEPQSRSRHSPSDNRSSDRGERKRAWRDDGDNEERGRGGGRDDRGPKLMKPGALGMKVLVPNSLVGAIIGKGGEEMKKLKEESNCFIRLSQNDKYFPNTNERPCYVEGVPEDIVKAIKVMQEKLINDNPRRGPSIDDNRKKLCKIIVGSNAAGKTIGKGGENVKRLNSEHSVWVKVMGRDDSIPGLEERTVTISGELENTLKAVQDILEMSAGLTNGGTDKNLDYDHFNMVGGNNFNQGGYGGNNYNQGGNFGNNQQGFNQGGNMGGRSGPPGPNMGRSGSMGPGPNMGPGNQGYNNMGGGPAPSGNNMGPGMGQGGNYNQSGPPVQQYNAQGPPQPSGQYQGNVQQYPPSNNSNNGNNNSGNSSNIPIQQYPGGSGSGPQSGGYGGGQGGGGYNQQQPGYNNQMGGGQFNQGPGGFNSGPGGSNPPGGYNQGQGGYNNQGGGYNNSSQGGYQGGNQGYQGGNQQGGDYQGGNQGGNYQGGRGGFQGGRGGNQSSGGRGNFRGNNRGGNRGGRGARGNSN